MSYWAAVPHYVAQPPCPKATLALLGRIEDLLEVSIPLGDLPEDARAWERGVDELAEEDEDIAEYVRSLEETRDTTELPEASGEAIAREFERYLKRRGASEPDRVGASQRSASSRRICRPLRRRVGASADGRPADAPTRPVSALQMRRLALRRGRARRRRAVATAAAAPGSLVSASPCVAEGGGHPGVDRRAGAGGVEVVGERREDLARPPGPRGRRRPSAKARRHCARVSTESQSSASSHSQSLR